MTFPLVAGIGDNGYDSAESDEETQHSPHLQTIPQESGEDLCPLPEAFFQNLKATLDEETCMGPHLHSRYYNTPVHLRPVATKCEPPDYIWSECNHISVTLGSRFAHFLSRPENRKWVYLGEMIIKNGNVWSGIKLVIQSIEDTSKALAMTPYANALFTCWSRWPLESYYLILQELSLRSVSEIEALCQCAPQLFASKCFIEEPGRNPSQLFHSGPFFHPLGESYRLSIFKTLRDVQGDKLRLITTAVPLLPTPYWREGVLIYPFQTSYHTHIVKALILLTVDDLKALHQSSPFSLEQILGLWRQEISMKDLIKKGFGGE